jgi:hypothetical protein
MLFIGALKLLLIQGYPIGHCHFTCQRSDQVIRNIIQLLEADTAFAHIQLRFAMPGIFSGKPFQQCGIGIDAHMIYGYKILLRSNTYKRQWQFRRTMITSRIQSFLKERINRLSPESNEEYVTRRSDISEQLVETIIGMLARVKMPLTLRAICDLLKGSNVVPVQILNVPIYVTRRLEKAVILGRIRFQLHGDDDKKRYSLPEWYEGEELLDAFKIR